MNGKNRPDGLGEFLNRRFGGELVAPQKDNPLGHAVDSNARLKGLTRIEGSAIKQAISEYYTSFGMEVEENDFGDCFFATGRGFALTVSFSNFTGEGNPNSRILITVSDTGGQRIG
ncbi:MAG: hypothetical protein NUV54_01875 [Candidatus Taylorbacteria bacterium]|nr:hypothetical protein [Candidatus Taylorbacteria bacterium]